MKRGNNKVGNEAKKINEVKKGYEGNIKAKAANGKITIKGETKMKQIINLIILKDKKAQRAGSVIMRCVLSAAMLLSNTAGYAYAAKDFKISLKNRNTSNPLNGIDKLYKSFKTQVSANPSILNGSMDERTVKVKLTNEAGLTKEMTLTERKLYAVLQAYVVGMGSKLKVEKPNMAKEERLAENIINILEGCEEIFRKDAKKAKNHYLKYSNGKNVKTQFKQGWQKYLDKMYAVISDINGIEKLGVTEREQVLKTPQVAAMRMKAKIILANLKTVWPQDILNGLSNERHKRIGNTFNVNCETNPSEDDIRLSRNLNLISDVNGYEKGINRYTVSFNKELRKLTKQAGNFAKFFKGIPKSEVTGFLVGVVDEYLRLKGIRGQKLNGYKVGVILHKGRLVPQVTIKRTYQGEPNNLYFVLAVEKSDTYITNTNGKQELTDKYSVLKHGGARFDRNKLKETEVQYAGSYKERLNKERTMKVGPLATSVVEVITMDTSTAEVNTPLNRAEEILFRESGNNGEKGKLKHNYGEAGIVVPQLVNWKKESEGVVVGSKTENIPTFFGDDKNGEDKSKKGVYKNEGAGYLMDKETKAAYEGYGMAWLNSGMKFADACENLGSTAAEWISGKIGQGLEIAGGITGNRSLEQAGQSMAEEADKSLKANVYSIAQVFEEGWNKTINGRTESVLAKKYDRKNTSVGKTEERGWWQAPRILGSAGFGGMAGIVFKSVTSKIAKKLFKKGAKEATGEAAQTIGKEAAGNAAKAANLNIEDILDIIPQDKIKHMSSSLSNFQKAIDTGALNKKQIDFITNWVQSNHMDLRGYEIDNMLTGLIQYGSRYDGTVGMEYVLENLRYVARLDDEMEKFTDDIVALLEHNPQLYGDIKTVSNFRQMDPIHLIETLKKHGYYSDGEKNAIGVLDELEEGYSEVWQAAKNGDEIADDAARKTDPLDDDFIVVAGDGTKIVGDEIIPQKVLAEKRDGWKSAIREIQEQNPAALSDEQIEYLDLVLNDTFAEKITAREFHYIDEKLNTLVQYAAGPYKDVPTLQMLVGNIDKVKKLSLEHLDLSKQLYEDVMKLVKKGDITQNQAASINTITCVNITGMLKSKGMVNPRTIQNTQELFISYAEKYKGLVGIQYVSDNFDIVTKHNTFMLNTARELERGEIVPSYLLDVYFFEKVDPITVIKRVEEGGSFDEVLLTLKTQHEDTWKIAQDLKNNLNVVDDLNRKQPDISMYFEDTSSENVERLLGGKDDIVKVVTDGKIADEYFNDLFDALPSKKSRELTPCLDELSSAADNGLLDDRQVECITRFIKENYETMPSDKLNKRVSKIISNSKKKTKKTGKKNLKKKDSVDNEVPVLNRRTLDFAGMEHSDDMFQIAEDFTSEGLRKGCISHKQADMINVWAQDICKNSNLTKEEFVRALRILLPVAMEHEGLDYLKFAMDNVDILDHLLTVVRDYQNILRVKIQKGKLPYSEMDKFNKKMAKKVTPWQTAKELDNEEFFNFYRTLKNDTTKISKNINELVEHCKRYRDIIPKKEIDRYINLWHKQIKTLEDADMMNERSVDILRQLLDNCRAEQFTSHSLIDSLDAMEIALDYSCKYPVFENITVFALERFKDLKKVPDKLREYYKKVVLPKFRAGTMDKQDLDEIKYILENKPLEGVELMEADGFIEPTGWFSEL